MRALHLASLVAVLCAVACGGPPEPAGASVSLALESSIASRVTELQVTLVASSATLDCGRVLAGCLKDKAQGAVLDGTASGKRALRVPFSPTGGGQDLSLQIEAGAYLVAIEGLDVEGRLVANACRLKVDLREGERTDLTLALQEYAGPACIARVE